MSCWCTVSLLLFISILSLNIEDETQGIVREDISIHGKTTKCTCNFKRLSNQIGLVISLIIWTTIAQFSSYRVYKVLSELIKNRSFYKTNSRVLFILVDPVYIWSHICRCAVDLKWSVFLRDFNRLILLRYLRFFT